ncbi:hypothetical protein BKA56DRAFT_607651 [Ilyonectria sp. MPI-CAGE-AT-0026]|nr:hypothetical protein BKA56DRAFT_607651 [Ilyonectria sp. MPI-CAGE-AT-0026]
MDYVLRLRSRFSLRSRTSSQPTSTSASGDNRDAIMNLTDLPFTIFLDIVLLLPPVDALRCRQVSSAWRSALTRQDLAISLILGRFPRAREARILRRWLASGGLGHRYAGDLEDTEWAAVFANLARRYFHLGAAQPWKTSKVQTFNGGNALWGVTPWNRFLKLHNRAADFQSWDPVWTFEPEDGLLVYPAASSTPLQRYRVRDLETGSEFIVPFDTAGKVIRRVRLHDKVLLFEWCEEHGLDLSHPVKTLDTAIRHYATAYDVVRHGAAALLPRRDAAEPGREWSFVRRAEWKIHHLGMLPTHQDRFFSAHNRTHYAVYVWQPARSPWGDDDPLERLIVWELGPAPPAGGSPGPETVGAGAGPRVVLQLANADLRAWGVGQRDTPSLRELALDATTWDETAQTACGHVYLVEETHRWAAGPHSSLTPPPLHRVRSTGIPLGGHGPRWLDNCDADGSNNPKNPQAGCRHSATSDSRDTWPGRAPCWRHDDFPFVTVSGVHDAPAGVHIRARQCFQLRSLAVHLPPSLRNPPAADVDNGERRAGWEVTRAAFLAMFEWSDMELEDLEAMHKRIDGPARESEVKFSGGLWDELLGKGFMSGSERWVVGEDAKGDITIVMF